MLFRSVVEEGKATAAAIRHLAATWARTGDNARQIFVAQKLSSLVSTLMSTVGDVHIDKVTFIDQSLLGRNGGGGNFAVNAAITNEQLKSTLGVDVAQLVRSYAERHGVTPPPAVVHAPAGPPPAPRPKRPTER